MACLSEEQIAQLALQVPEEPGVDKLLLAHVEECAVCRARLTESRRVVEQLSATHAKLEQEHPGSKGRLMAVLSNVEVARETSGLQNEHASLGALSVWKKIAAVGVGVAVLAAMVLFSMMLSSGHRLSAMERMAKELNEVTSYSFKTNEHVTLRKKGMTEPGIVDLSQLVYWEAPGTIREDLKIVLNGAVPNGYRPGQEQTDIVSISRTDGLGILIDRLTKSYSQESKLRADDTGSGSVTYPNSIIRKIREEEGKVERDLGTKKIGDKQAHGYAMLYKNDTDPIEVWLDPETDLPLEINSTAKDETTTDVMHYTDLLWNVVLDPKLFDTTPPAGYSDTAPPNDVKTVAEITAALRLYAELSGGHYPQIDTYQTNAKFDADAIHDEMLRMAGFSGPAQALWAKNEKYREVQGAKAGLDSIAKIVRGNAGYHGAKVGPSDKNKILLWWLNGGLNGALGGYQVFYGDLRGKILTKAEAEKEIPRQPKLWDEEPTGEGKPAERHSEQR